MEQVRAFHDHVDDHDDIKKDQDDDHDMGLTWSFQLPSYPGMFPAYKVVPGTSYEVKVSQSLSSNIIIVMRITKNVPFFKITY